MLLKELHHWILKYYNIKFEIIQVRNTVIASIFKDTSEKIVNHCLKYSFYIIDTYILLLFFSLIFSLFETTQTLFWAVFGLVDLDSFELDGIKIFTRFWGMLMFGTYSVINIVVLLNLLIAMMNHSYQLISVS